MSSWTVTFEYVSAERHPEYFCRCNRVHPFTKPERIPKEHWTPVSVTHTNHPDAVAQFRNLRMLQGGGQFLRHVSITSDEDLRERVGAE